MKKIFLLSIFLLSIFLLLSDAYAKNKLSDKNLITPSQAVLMLDENNKEWSKKIRGVFEFTVKGSGKDDKWGFLNSHKNYRVKENLTIKLSKHIRKRLTKKYGQDPLEFLKGKMIRVKGEAKKVKIYKVVDGKKTNLVYFQAHVILKEIKHIEIIEK